MSQRFVSKVWEDMQAEYPTRYTVTKTDLSQEVVTMSENFGNVSVQGDIFDKQTMENLESRIDAGFDTVEDITSGTSDPSGGKNGDIYFKTEAVDNVTSVIGMFVKIGGTWLEVSVGGASLPQAEGSGF